MWFDDYGEVRDPDRPRTFGEVERTTRSPAGRAGCRRRSARTPPSRRRSVSPARAGSEVPNDLHLRRLAKMSKAAEFLNALKTDDYGVQMAVFRWSAQTVSKRAKEGNLDGATLA